MLVTHRRPVHALRGAAAAAAVDPRRPLPRLDRRAALHPQVFERYHEAARKSGCGMLTAFGYDFVPGNLAGALALERAGERAVRVDVGYFFTGKAGCGAASGGTMASLAGVATAPVVRLPRRPGAAPSAPPPGSAPSTSRARSAGHARSAPPSTSRCRGWRRGCSEVNAYLGWFGAGVARHAGRLARHLGAHEAARRGERLGGRDLALREGLHRRPGRGGALQERLAHRGHRLRRAGRAARRGAPDGGQRLHVHRAHPGLGRRAGRRRRAEGHGGARPGRRLRPARARARLRRGRARGRRRRRGRHACRREQPARAGA